LKPFYLINHAQSLIGKDFKIFLQAIPFIFFPLMTAEQRALWLSLAHLSSYLFQTHITYMPTYLEELKQHISIFMSHIIKHTAQWINKPKFHILFHLPESISRAGTANLFSTEKFESFNGVLRNSSTHSNKQAPGKDIAINFSNYQSLRFLLSGGVSYNKITGSTSQCFLELRNFFTNNPVIQKSLGFNSELSNPATQYPFQKQSTLKKEDEEPVPASLLGQFPGGNICQIAQLQLNAHENIFKSSFILVSQFFIHNLQHASNHQLMTRQS
jgi:hypothetical protein